jgi:glucose-1-phosphate thymidylyltransferase
VGCIEEVAYRQGFISADELRAAGKKYKKSGYGQYLFKVLEWRDDLG